MPRVGAERQFVAFQQLDLAMDGKHFLNESPAEMQQPHGKCRFIVRAKGGAGLGQELTEVRPQVDGSRRLAAAGGAGFEQYPVRDFTGSTKVLRVRKAVVAPEPANRDAFLWQKRKGRMRGDGVTQRFKSPIYSIAT